MNDKLKRFRSTAMFTIVGGVIVINPAFAQDPASSPPDAATTLDSIEVVGIRSSLNEAMNIKRETPGVVDAISAEDIGKFPDTNLAESLQRITGISIERRDGEGAQVTARGFGPQFNLVTLNGRQIPGADAFGAAGQVAIGGVEAGTRAFNFAQLASEAISGIEVYKTGQASVPSGGIGATINILTDRPFNHPGGEIVASAGAKAVYDDSQIFDSDITPEASAILSYASPDKVWGAGLSASYQKRHGGSVQATENNWNVARWNGPDGILRPGGTIVNEPEIGQLYALPNDLRYAFSDFERERINGQGVLQFAPSDAVILTLDYTFSRNEIEENRGEQAQWLQQGSYTHLEFDGGEVATPTYLREIVETKDFGYEQQRNMQKYELDSIGINADWQVSTDFRLVFDAHNTTSESSPNDPATGGGSTYFSMAGTNNCTNGPYCGGAWSQEMWFNSGLPVMARTWYPSMGNAAADSSGVVNPDFPVEQIGAQVLRVNALQQKTEVKQGRLDGVLDFDQGRFQFGVDSSETTMTRRQAQEQYSTLGDWSAANTGNEPGMYPLLSPINIVGLFDDFAAPGAPTGAWRGDTTALGQWAVDAYGANFSVSPILSADNRIEEETRAAYMQVELDGSIGEMPTHTRIGVRYEKTDLTSTSAVATPTAVQWEANNDFRIVRSAETQPFSETHSYSYILPNLDFSLDVTEDIKARASFSETIARAPYSNLYAGPGPNQPTGSVLISEAGRADGNANTPTLDPIESDNLDLALEWYFADASYVSITYWNKRVDNFIGNTVVQESLYGLTDPTSGPDAQAALDFLTSAACAAQVGAAGNDVGAACSANNTALFTALALYRNAAETGGLAAYNGSGAQVQAMENAYDLVGAADDPLYMFNVNRPVNQNSAKLRGWELGGQYFFGDSGFGVYANYTIVNGDVGYDDAGDPTVDQFSLLGLSDTANLMLMYEKYGWSARVAWNWRDEYLILANQGGSRNPYYVEAYDQVDLSVNYAFNDRWSAGFEAINVTGEDVRWHGRSDEQIVRLLDQSPRYTLGVRYRF
ncbi:TonB-dependent receptor [Coralloluteibacterium stylophorae]|uniref:TonB-dependent receptor n=2 Tax=Coralloluteibacterium stylophorae TaxID=1776034 RepID=A0AAP2CFD0_9GAMM|nr:TonB-dependent receptor [Coralloluteibacterium stylophorae]MBS7458665.1 TonB-dependent receptor [Coralloluteibacterium stylophorae]